MEFLPPSLLEEGERGGGERGGGGGGRGGGERKGERKCGNQATYTYMYKHAQGFVYFKNKSPSLFNPP